MGRHGKRRGAVRDDGLSVQHDGRDHVWDIRDITGRRPDAAEGSSVEGEALSDKCEAAEPENYGVRVDWQPEDVRIEAAEFLVATRTEHEARLRASSELEHRHHHDDR